MSAVQYAYLNATVAYLSRYLLDKNDFETLINALPQNIERIQKANIHIDMMIKPAQFEQLLIRRLLDEATLLIRGVQGSDRRVLMYWLSRFELINLKSLLRAKFLRLPIEQIRPLLLDLGEWDNLPMDALLATDSPEELLRHLNRSPYHRSAEQARKALREQGDLFDVEAVLDKQYYEQLHHFSQLVDHAQRQSLNSLIGHYLDQINLITILRFRFNYGLSSPHTYFLLAPAGTELSDERLQTISQLDQIESVLNALPRQLKAKLEGAADIETISQRLDFYTQSCARRLLNRPFQLSRALAYLYLREKQMQWIHTIVKGYQLDLTVGLMQSCLTH